jgi:hypothetical protein
MCRQVPLSSILGASARDPELGMSGLLSLGGVTMASRASTMGPPVAQPQPQGTSSVFIANDFRPKVQRRIEPDLFVRAHRWSLPMQSSLSVAFHSSGPSLLQAAPCLYGSLCVVQVLVKASVQSAVDSGVPHLQPTVSYLAHLGVPLPDRSPAPPAPPAPPPVILPDEQTIPGDSGKLRCACLSR